MYHHVGAFAIVTHQQFLYLRSLVVCLAKWNMAIHQNMQFDGVVISDATSTQIVWFCHSLYRACQVQYLFLDLIRQRLLH